MPSYADLQARFDAGDILIMDGGMGSEIQRRGVPLSRSTWSARAVSTHPDLVREISMDFIKAGAEIIIANTYSTGKTTLARAGRAEVSEQTNREATQLALEARERAKASWPVWVCGSMSPCAPELAVEPQPRAEDAQEQYEEQARVFKDLGVDIILLETFYRLVDMKEALKAADKTGLPVWLGVCTDAEPGGELLGLHGPYYSGETLSQALDIAKDFNVKAHFINHGPPARTTETLKLLREKVSGPIGAYAHIMGDQLAPSMTPKAYYEHAQDWAEIGAQVIGGCCGVTDDHIRELKEHLPAKIRAKS